MKRFIFLVVWFNCTKTLLFDRENGGHGSRLWLVSKVLEKERAPVAQRQEASDLGSEGCGFESHPEYYLGRKNQAGSPFDSGVPVALEEVRVLVNHMVAKRFDSAIGFESRTLHTCPGDEIGRRATLRTLWPSAVQVRLLSWVSSRISSVVEQYHGKVKVCGSNPQSGSVSVLEWFFRGLNVNQFTRVQFPSDTYLLL